MTVRELVPLASLTTFKVGGPARYVIDCTSDTDVQEALAFAAEKSLPYAILGGGSNVLALDDGYQGVVIRPCIGGITMEGETIVAGAGVVWDELVQFATTHGLWGIENLSGIPGLVGGAVFQNIGAYGAALSQTLVWTDVFDSAEGKLRRLTTEECGFGYRDSIFKREPNRLVVLRAAFHLTPEMAPNLSYHDPNKAYKDIARIFSENPNPSLSAIREAVLSIRADKFPDLTKEGTAGSFFVNALLPEEQARALQERYPGMPIFAMPETTDWKVPVGWILDQVLHLHGFSSGKARLFEHQAMVIATAEGAHAGDVISLAEEVSRRVLDATGIVLEWEVRTLK